MKINLKTLKELFEQASQEALAASPPQTPEAQQQPPQQAPAQPAAQPQNNPQSQTSGGVVTVDKIVDHLNGIRSGKSFNDPLVFTAITNIFNGLSSSERAVLDKALSQLDKSIEQITKQQSPPNPNNQEVKGPAVQPQINAPGASTPNGFQGPQQVQQMMGASPVSGMMSGVLAEGSKNYFFPNSLRSSKKVVNNSFFELAKGKEDLVAEIVLKALKKSPVNADLAIKETLNGLAKNQLIGEYVKSILKGKTLLTITQESILKLFLNLETILKFVEETKDQNYLKFKGEEKVVKAIFDDIVTQDAFTEEKNAIENIVQRAFNEIKKNDTNAKKKETIIKIIKSEIDEIGENSFAIYDKLSTLSESINSPNRSTVIIVNGKEVSFGSPEHLGQLTIVLNGLESLKSCYRKGSSARSTLAGACQKIRKILNDNAGAAVGTVQPLMNSADKE